MKPLYLGRSGSSNGSFCVSAAYGQEVGEGVKTLGSQGGGLRRGHVDSERVDGGVRFSFAEGVEVWWERHYFVPFNSSSSMLEVIEAVCCIPRV